MQGWHFGRIDQQTSIRLMLTLALAAWGASMPARVSAGTVFHVDWEGGSDNADGRTPETAWKRAPGDSRAGQGPRSVALGPGDTVVFRGGVAYRGTVVLRVSGTADRPVRFVGEGWGPARATIDGGEPVPARPCRSARDCAGEAGWANLWRLTLPRHAPADAPLFQAGSALVLETAADQKDPSAVREIPSAVREIPGAVREIPGAVRAVPGKRIAIARPLIGKSLTFSVGMGRPGFLLVAGRHIEIAGFSFANFADFPRKGPFAGAPLAQLQPVDGVQLTRLTLEDTGFGPPLRRAAPPVRAIAGYVRAPI